MSGEAHQRQIKLNIKNAEGFSDIDRRQLMAYIASLDPKPERIIIGHEDEQVRRSSIVDIQKFNIETRAPMNLETIRMK